MAGVFGELLLTAGIVALLFVVWQVWWTDVTAARYAQGALDNVVAAVPPAPTAPIPQAQMHPAPGPTAGPGANQTRRDAVLRIPRFGAEHEVVIREGVAVDSVLNRGLAGHYPGTAQAGQLGNFAIAGHRQSHGAIFRNLDALIPGDPLIVQDGEAWFVYRVTDSQVVLPSATEVIAPVPGEPGAPPSAALITLTTCHPLWSTSHRLVVHGELDYWAPLSAGTPSELLGKG